MRIVAICGSLQANSSNLHLLTIATDVAPGHVTVHHFDGIADLPHYNPDLDKEGPPASVTAWRHALAESDAVLIASPEYGHSLPGVLKNAVDWVIGSGELVGKPVAITASTASSERGRLGLEALRATLGAVEARVVGGEPIVRGAGASVAMKRLLESLVEEVTRSADPTASPPGSGSNSDALR